jgi:phage gp36-like protein
MPYTTKANMIARFGEQELIQRTDRANPPMGAIDDAVLSLAMARADAFADGKLRTRYAVPIAAPSLDLLTQCENKARRFLYDDGMPQAVKDGDDEANAWFDDVAKGRVLLDAAAASSQTAGAVGEAVFAETTNAFACPY